jgi:uncharacterized cupin superfamily protein
MTDKAANPIINIADAPLRDNGDGGTFQAKIGRLGALIGMTGMGCTLTVVPPGKRAYPFHRHHVTDEFFFILLGSGEYRYGGETLPVKQGDLVGAPAGKEAHQLINNGSDDLRYLAFSTIGSVDIVEYPDSGKMAAAAGVQNADFKTATFVALGHVQPAEYWKGER